VTRLNRYQVSHWIVGNYNNIIWEDKTMSSWNEPVTENGVEVHYSSDCELYHLTSDKGDYDAKIDVYPNHYETYIADSSNWDKHIHVHTDSEGNTTEAHGMESKSWRTTCRS
jgi:hypothetical protein